MFSFSIIRWLTIGFSLFAASVVCSLPETSWALGSTPVTVVNPADIAKAEGIQHTIQFLLTCGSGQSCSSFAVPSNRRLVIEHVSVNCSIDPGVQLTYMGVATTVGGLSLIHNFNIVDHVGAGGETNLAEMTRVYADPGTTVDSFVSATGRSSCFLNLSGQSIEMP
jgi:hypothetical protein